MLDVRDADSFRKAHIDGAQHLSTKELSAVIGGTPKNRPILIYCYHGNASREFAQTFSDFGFVEVYSLEGGYRAWSNRPRPQDHPMLDDTLRHWLAAQGFPPDNVNAVIANGTTPLMKASHQGQGGIVRALTAAGAQLDARNADGNNALWLACVGGHLDIIDILVEAGIDINNRNDNRATPLMYGASSGKAAVVARLLAKGVDTTPETLDGFTALDLASTVECLTLLRGVRPAGIKPPQRDAGTTPPRP
jgi:thiosulfate/3-mercaptopyruvate sulfurtransferase